MAQSIVMSVKVEHWRKSRGCAADHLLILAENLEATPFEYAEVIFPGLELPEGDALLIITTLEEKEKE